MNVFIIMLAYITSRVTALGNIAVVDYMSEILNFTRGLFMML